MEIITAKTAGFCFGVNRAVNLTQELAQSGVKVATLGPLIHNPQCVAALEAQGVVTAHSIDDIPKDFTVVIRSHGVGKNVYDELKNKNYVIKDATCPFVTKIHQLAQKAKDAGAVLLIAGDKHHPEVEGIMGHADKSFVFLNLEELKAISVDNLVNMPIFAVAQTTFEVTNWLECANFIKKVYTNALVFDTICNATWARQDEAQVLAKKSDLMIIIGGRHSSNTQKLVSVAQKYTRTISIETASELTKDMLHNVKCVAVTAGASTPASIIEEVLNNMSEIVRDEELSFAEMFDTFETPSVYGGKDVKGIVTGVSPNEIQVDIGTKHTGFVKLEELTDDPNAHAGDLVKKGDELDLIVVKVNDMEGIVYLSKKQFDARKGEIELRECAENGKVLTGFVVESNKGGLVARVNGVKVFIPASQSTLRRGEDYTLLVRTQVNLKITKCEGSRFVGSIREVLSQVADSARDEFWNGVVVGKQYKGIVKNLTTYGAFVDIGGVDGLVHISELSWSRIKHPSEVLTVGSEIDVFVKDLDAETHKVSLGYKKSEDDPWEKLRTDFPIGSVFTAKVVSTTKFGAFVNIMPGIDGLIHISEISNERVEKVGDALAIGQEVQVKLTDIDFEKKRISLSMKALLETAEAAE